MTAIGHFSMISETEINPSIITFVMTLKGKKPFHDTELIQLWKERHIHLRHPRYHSTIDSHSRQHFIPKDYNHPQQTTTTKHETNDPNDPNKNEPDLQSHISDTLYPHGGKKEIIERVKGMQMERWSLYDTLWHIDIAPWGPFRNGLSSSIQEKQKDTSNHHQHSNSTKQTHEQVGESIIFFRGHHVLGDGASMGASLLDLFDEGVQLQEQILNSIQLYYQMLKEKNKKSFWYQYIQYLQKMIYFLIGALYGLSYQCYLHVMSNMYDTNPWKLIEQYSNTHDDHVNGTDRTLSYTNVVQSMMYLFHVYLLLLSNNCSIIEIGLVSSMI
jgi:hypothetical protein